MGPTHVPVEPPAPVRVTSRAGSVVVAGEERTDVLVERGANQVHSTADGLSIEGRAGTIVARCPIGTDVFVGARAGSVTLHGALGAARVTTRSGSITVEQAREVDARTRSGSIEVGRCDGACRAQSGSGRLRVGHAASIELSSGSGSVDVDAVGGGRVRAGSGSIAVGLVAAGTLELETHAGSVTVTVPAGLRPAVALRARHGRVRCDCEPGTDGEIRVATGSGQIAVIER